MHQLWEGGGREGPLSCHSKEEERGMVVEFLLAMLPIIFLIIAMSVVKMPGWLACLIAAVIAGAVGIIRFHLGITETMTAALEGALNALWPIILVIIAALFTYNITLETGAMDKIKAMLAGVSMDKRVILLIIGWGFGNFMEGMAGFGTAVAIPASILVGMGFDPIRTVVALLLVNSTPTAFGSVGVPTTTMANVTGLDVLTIAGQVVQIQLVPVLLSAFLMVTIVGGGFRALKGLFGFTLVGALSFVIPQYIAATFIGAELPNIIGAIISMVCMIVFALARKNKPVPEEYRIGAKDVAHVDLTVGSAVVAWSPFILIFVILLLTSSIFPVINRPLSAIHTTAQIFSGENPGSLTFYWINTPGVLIMIAGLIGGLIQGLGIGKIVKIYLKTVAANWKTIVTICSVLAVAKIMGYSGMISAIAKLLVAVTGAFYPLISPLIGMLGGFVTGSGTSTTVLFGTLQTETAAAIGIKGSWLAAANLCGAGIGKAISPQGVAIGCASAGLTGKESKIMGKTFGYCVLFAVIAGVLCYVLPMIG